MASTRIRTTKDGQTFYEIRVSRGRGRSYLTTRWYPPAGWSQKAIDRALTKEAAEFERRCHEGEVTSRAEQKENDLRQKQGSAKIQTLRHYGEKVFIPAKTVTMSENGRCAYQGNLDHWIYPTLGELKMPDITAADISALLLSMQSVGKANAICVKVYTILHSLFKMAYMSDVPSINPMDRVGRPKPRKSERRDKPIEAYTASELQRIFSAIDTEPLKWRVLMRLLIDTGIRRGECCGLQWKDIDFSACTVTISGNLCYTPQKGATWILRKAERCGRLTSTRRSSVCSVNSGWSSLGRRSVRLYSRSRTVPNPCIRSLRPAICRSSPRSAAYRIYIRTSCGTPSPASPSRMGPTWQACPKSSATVTRPLRSVCTLTQIRKAFVVPVKFSEMR